MRSPSKRPLAALLAAAIVPTALAAQAPRVTPAGDPSVKPDTIYRLAVDTAAYPDDGVVFLLDDGIVRVESDGRGSRTFRQVVQVLTPQAAENYREHRFSYSPKHERLTINWVRVVRMDGTVVSDAPTMVQDADVPARMGDPVYSDTKVRRISLSGVEAGTIVDFSYTTEELKPYLAGDFYQFWSVSAGVPVRRSRYVVDAPAALKLHIDERNLAFRRTETVKGGRRTLTWAAQDVPKVEGEAYAADSNGVSQNVIVSTLGAWGDVARWYAGNARDRYALGSEAAAKAAGMLKGAATRDDSVRALHRWVAQDVRYVSIALGMGGYQPRTPDEVLRTGFGDCKDKATLFVAALRAHGIEAYPVLLSADGGVRRALPSIAQFDHAIAAVKTPAGYQFTDLTASLVPYGELPLSEQGEFALVVHPDGASEEVTLPQAPIAANRDLARIVGRLAEDGTFTGSWEVTATGFNQGSLREAFEHPLDSTARANGAKALARRLFEGADGDSLVGFDGKDLAATPRMRVRILNAKAVQQAGDMTLLTLPIGSMSGLATAARELGTKKRRYPIDAAKVMGMGEDVTEIRVTLPAGWRARLPKGVKASGPFGSYESEYAQEGNELRVTRRTVGATGILPPERLADLTSFFQEIAKDDARFIVLEKGN